MGWRPSETKAETPFDIWVSWLKFSRYHSGEPERNPLSRDEFNAILKGYDPNGKRA